jgi:excisionase family DNA binding protein
VDPQAPSEGAPVLDATEVARLLRLNVDYVRKLSREGVLPAHKLPGGRPCRYSRGAVLDWRRRHPAGAGAGGFDRSVGFPD